MTACYPVAPVAIYARVSTDRQDAAAQLPALLGLAEARGWPDPHVVTEVESGARARPLLDALVADCQRGRHRVIIVWALDRLGRSMFEVIARVQALDAAGVRVVSHQEPWLDTGGPTRSLLLAVFAWVSEQERSRLIERTRAGLERARAKGRRLGRPLAADAPDPSAVLDLRRAGRSWTAVALTLGCTPSAARRAAARMLVENPPENEPHLSVGERGVR